MNSTISLTDVRTNRCSKAAPRADNIFEQLRDQNRSRVDGLFAILMFVQYLALVGTSIWLTPYAWNGRGLEVHQHVWLAILGGGVIALVPAICCGLYRGSVWNEWMIAVAQMTVSAMFIHLTGGHIESHFHVFGSLAFLAMYRDWRVLIIGTAVIASDHLLRAVYFPFSAFGVDEPSLFKAFEHAGWVVFEDTILLYYAISGTKEWRQIANQRAGIQAEYELLFREVRGLHREILDAAAGAAPQGASDDSQSNARKATSEAPIWFAQFSDLRSAVRQLVDCWRSVNSSSTGLQSRSQEVLAGTLRQESAMGHVLQHVDQLAATIGEIQAFTQDTTHRVSTAISLASDSRETLDASNRTISDVQELAGRIREMAKEIQSIASMTNLLALNATIESARAGEAGKGFGVVACEVKELARRTNATAHSITQVIEEAVEQVQTGITTGHETAGKLAAIMECIEGIDQQMAHINDSTRFHADTAESILGLITDVSDIVKSSAANSRELAEASEQLTRQANRLETLGARV
ncbi:MAG: methyl-accepting chemotaxis protein [Pirellulales bacterium]